MIKAGSDYGPFKNGGKPIGALIHDLEAPPKPGMARGLIDWVNSKGLSPHTMSDPTAESVQVLTEMHSGAHAGTHANESLVAFEITGYADYTADQWAEATTFEAVKAAARSVGRLWQVMGWDTNNVEWGSVQQLKDTYAAWDAGQPYTPRLWAHFDVSRAWPQDTTHTDPGKFFPYKGFRELVKQYLGSGEEDFAFIWGAKE